MIYCLNSNCSSPENPKNNKYCQKCGNSLILRNHYRPVKLLGGGGFGQVYLAEDIDRLNEFCVIKKFESNVQENEALQKAKELFEQEAKQLQKLGEHPQIPQLYAYFQEQGQFYIIQQYIEGDTLEQELKKQGVFNEEKITSLLKELLNILKFLHQNNTIHRDIKPANIIRRSQTVTEQGSLVLIDLGIAKQVNKTTIKTGTRIGTFGYMPMEQMQEGKVSPASDLYSLGATCFHLLSGVDPWELWKIKGYNWTKEWQNEIKQPLSNNLVKVINKLLQIEYKERYQSAQEVLDDLERMKPKNLGSSGSPSVIQNNHKIVNFIIKSIVLTLCGFGLIYIGVIWRQEHQITFLCTKLDNCAKDKQFQEIYTKNQEKAESIRNSQVTDLETLQKNRTSLKDIINQLQTIPKNTKVFDSAQKSLTEYQQVLQQLERKIAQEEIRQKYSDSEAKAQAKVYNNEGWDRYNLGDNKGAIENYNQAILFNPNYAFAYNNRGASRSRLGDDKGAIEDYNKAISLNPNYALAYHNRAIANYNLGDNQQAKQDFEKAATLYKEQGNIEMYKNTLEFIDSLSK